MTQAAVKEYIDAVLEERQNPAGTTTQSRLAQAVAATPTAPLVALKQAIDNKISNALASTPAGKALSEDLTKQIIQEFDQNELNELEVALEKNQKAAKDLLKDVPFAGNLILSEIFLPNAAPATRAKPDDNKLAELLKDGLNFSMFERQRKSVPTGRNNKLLIFLKMLNKMDLKLKYRETERSLIEGVLLLVIYSNREKLHEFVFSSYFSNFLENFVKCFEAQYERDIRTRSPTKYPHLFLLSAYDKRLCSVILEVGALEAVSSVMIKSVGEDQEEKKEIAQVDDNLNVFLMLFSKLINGCPRAIESISMLQLMDTLVLSPSAQLDPSSIALIANVLQFSQRLRFTPKQLLSKEGCASLFQKVFEQFEVHDDFSQLVTRMRAKKLEFTPADIENDLQLLDTFRSINSKDLLKGVDEKYWGFYHVAKTSLKFLAKVEFPSKDEAFLKRAFINTQSLITMYYYQPSILKNGMKALTKCVSSANYEDFCVMVFCEEFLHNVISHFKRSILNESSVKVLHAVQQFLLIFFDFLQATSRNLNADKIYSVFNALYSIRVLVLEFFQEIKKRYLSKSLVKYISKVKYEFQKELIDKLDLSLSLNSLIIQRISQTHSLQRNFNMYIQKKFSDSFLSDGGLENKLVISEKFENAQKVIYFAMRSGPKDAMMGEIVEFNLRFMKKSEELVDFLAGKTNVIPFEIAQSLIEILILNLFFIKTRPDHFKDSLNKHQTAIFQLFTRVLHSAKNFCDFNSNYQIYSLIEQFNLFWILLFNFKFDFLDRFDFLFIENLKTSNYALEGDLSLESEGHAIERIINFFSEIVDLRTKCVYLNFVALKQIDLMYQTARMSALNVNLAVNVFQKAMRMKYSHDVFRVSPKYIINFSTELLALTPVAPYFVRFVYDNFLFFNPFVVEKLRKILDQNVDFDFLPHQDKIQLEIFNAIVKKDTLPATEDTIKGLFVIAQKSIRQKFLFKDTIQSIKGFLQKNPQLAKVNVEVLLLKTNIFDKLLRLYKKDKVNLAKIFADLLQIAKDQDLLGKLNIPEVVLSFLLKSTDSHQFHSVYPYIFEFMIAKKIAVKYDDQVKKLLEIHLEFFLQKVYFSGNFKFESEVQKIYFSAFILSSSSKISLDRLITREALMKNVIQILHENGRMEISDSSNLYHVFTKNIAGVDPKSFKFEKNLAKIVLQIAQGLDQFNQTLKNFTFIAKVLNYCYYLMDELNLEEMRPLFGLILKQGMVNSEAKSQTVNIFIDFFTVINYRLGFEAEPDFSKMVSKILIKQNNLPEFDFSRPIQYDIVGINSLLRQLLQINFCLSLEYDVGSQKEVVEPVCSLLLNNYESIRKVAGLEQLAVDILFRVGRKGVKSNAAAKIIYEIFSQKTNFKLDSNTNKFTYIKLFNLFAEVIPLTETIEFRAVTFDISITSTPDPKTLNNFQNLGVYTRDLNELLKHTKALTQEDEANIYDFILNLRCIDLQAVNNIDVIQEFYLKKQVEIAKDLGDLNSGQKVNIDLLQKKLGFICLYFEKEKKKLDKEIKIFFNGIQQIIEGINNHFSALSTFSNEEMRKFLKEPPQINLVVNEIALLETLYEITTEKNYCNVKPKILETLFHLIPIFNGPDDFGIEIFILFDRILQCLLNIIKYRYDEFRIAKFPNILPRLFNILLETPLDHLPNVHFGDPTVRPTTDDFFLTDKNVYSVFEKLLFIFVCFSRSFFLISVDFRKELWEGIKTDNAKILSTRLGKIFYTLLFDDIEEAPSSQTEKQVVRHMVTLGEKQKNILYVHKTLVNLEEIIRTRAFEPKEEQFMDFAIVGLQKNFFENMDPDVFNQLKLFSILSSLFVSPNLDKSYKQEVLMLMKLYLENTEDDNEVQFEETLPFINYHKKAIKDQDPELTDIYFVVLVLMIKHVKLTKTFVSEFFTDLNLTFFAKPEEIKTPIIISVLKCDTMALRKYDFVIDFLPILNLFYNYMKKLGEEQSLNEKLHFAETISLIDTRTPIESVRLQNFFLFLKLRFRNDSVVEVVECVESIQRLTPYPKFQEMMRVMGFELLFKTLMKSFGNNKEISIGIARSFLKFTYQSQDNKFEMYETLRALMQFITDYNRQRERDLVILLFKCLINASLIKKNSDYMIKAGLHDVIAKTWYDNDDEFHVIVLSLLFNISHQFEDHETRANSLFDSVIQKKIAKIFEQTLNKRDKSDQTVLQELLTLMGSLVQNNRCELFTADVFTLLKKAISLYYDDVDTVSKILSIIREISGRDDKLKDLIADKFDFVYLYNIHFRHNQIVKINLQVKGIILNILNHRRNTITEQDIVLYGIPENIIHSFSMRDNYKVLLVNLRIIRFACRFEKPRLVIKTHFISPLREIIFDFGKETDGEVTIEAFEILEELLKHAKSFAALQAEFVFDDANRLYDLAFYYEESERQFAITLKLIKNLLEKRPEIANTVGESQRQYMIKFNEKKRKSMNRDMLQDLFDVCDKMNLQRSIENTVGSAKLIFLPETEKQSLTSGVPVLALYQKAMNRTTLLKYDFAESVFVLENLPHYNRTTKTRSTRLQVPKGKVEGVDKLTKEEIIAVDDNMRTFFNKRVSRDLYMNVCFWVPDESGEKSESFILIFDNEFQCKKWTNVIKMLVGLL